MNTKMNNLILHIGIQRTGSTFLQKEIFPKMKINFEKAGNITDFKYFKNMENFSSEGIKSKINYFLKDNIVNLISDENLWWHENLSYNSRFKRLDKIHQVFPNSKIIFGIRNREELLLSWYKKYVIKGGTLNFLDFQKKIVSYKDLDFKPYIKKLNEKFEKDNVYIYQFEILKKQPKSFVKKLSDFIDVEPPEFENKKYNKGYSLWQLKLSLLLNHLWKTKVNPNGMISIPYNKIPYRRLFQNPDFPEILNGRNPTIKDLGRKIR